MFLQLRILFIFFFTTHSIFAESGTMALTTSLNAISAARALHQADLQKQVEANPEDEEKRKELEAMKANDNPFEKAAQQANQRASKAGTEGVGKEATGTSKALDSGQTYKTIAQAGEGKISSNIKNGSAGFEVAPPRKPGMTDAEYNQLLRKEGKAWAEANSSTTGKPMQQEYSEVREVAQRNLDAWKEMPENTAGREAAIERLNEKVNEALTPEKVAVLEKYTDKYGWEAADYDKSELAIKNSLGKGAADTARQARIGAGLPPDYLESAVQKVSNSNSQSTTRSPSSILPEKPIANSKNSSSSPVQGNDTVAYKTAYEQSKNGMLTAADMKNTTYKASNGNNLAYSGVINLQGYGNVHTWGGQYAYLPNGTYIRLNQIVNLRNY